MCKPSRKSVLSEIRCESIFPSIFFVIICAAFNGGVQVALFVDKDIDEISILGMIGMELIGTSVIYVIPVVFIPCILSHVQKAFKFLRIAMIWNIIGMVMTVIGGLMTIFSSFDNPLLYMGIAFMVFGFITLGLRYLWTYWSLFKTMKQSLPELEQEMITFSTAEERRKNHKTTYQQVEQGMYLQTDSTMPLQPMYTSTSIDSYQNDNPEEL